jgi:hypothetical protein
MATVEGRSETGDPAELKVGIAGMSGNSASTSSTRWIGGTTWSACAASRAWAQVVLDHACPGARDAAPAIIGCQPSALAYASPARAAL